MENSIDVAQIEFAPCRQIRHGLKRHSRRLVIPPRVRECRQCRIHTDHVCLREDLGQIGRRLAGAASEVENPFRAERQLRLKIVHAAFDEVLPVFAGEADAPLEHLFVLIA